MRDPEFIVLRNRFLGAIFIVLLFSIPILVFLVKIYGTDNSNVFKMLNNDESFVFLISGYGCDECEQINEVMENNNVGHFILNKDKHDNYKKVVNKLGLSVDDDIPAIVYVENGKLKSYLVNVEDGQEVLDFLNSYSLIN